MARRDPKKLPPYEMGWQDVIRHPLFSAMSGWRVPDKQAVGRGGWVIVDCSGHLLFDPDRPGTHEEWKWVFAYGLLQLGLGHLPVREPAELWVAAADVATQAFLETLKIGRRPRNVPRLPEISARSAEDLFARFRAAGLPRELQGFGLGGEGRLDLRGSDPSEWQLRSLQSAERSLAHGLTLAVRSALEVASGKKAHIDERRTDSRASQAMSWFIASYPLLGALAASFELVEDVEACRALDIQIAAVDPAQQRIYVNPTAALSEDETRFVLAHEMLHAGLCHDARRQGRDAFLWNVACDYVINGWLVQMQVGSMPGYGCLHDPELKGESAEGIYDRIANDLRRMRRLATLRGRGLGDVLTRDEVGWWQGAGCDLDAFYRRALITGLDLCSGEQRGTLPAGLVQEIRALSQPPIPWDVELAQWFDRYFTPVERRRTYARPSRRQASTPDIPRPRYVLRDEDLAGRTFGVVLDTSGSMDTQLLGKALGAIASYAASRDVPAARVVFCDAHPYDAGYMPVEAIAERVRVVGRGGTVLQPGIDLLERAKDFPRSGPILIITDAECDVLRVRREHAFLIPEGKRLPFRARGEVFRICP